MKLIKNVKNKAYFKRFQVKLRRRREGKTDYLARKILIHQDKNKYNTKKYRFVVRITNTKVICQVIYATLIGDMVVCSADSTELKRYGIPVGLTNYSAAYSTGLLLARRLLKQYKMDKAFTGLEEITGEDYDANEDYEDVRPFKCLLDVGIIRTTRGNRVFGAMKGACDGGLYIPHSTKKFFGYNKNDDSYDAEAHRDRIFGTHVASYMKHLQENDPDKYVQHFSEYIKHHISADNLQNMYTTAHQNIRLHPEMPEKTHKNHQPINKTGNVIHTQHGSYVKYNKLTNKQKKDRVGQKIQIIKQTLIDQPQDSE